MKIIYAYLFGCALALCSVTGNAQVPVPSANPPVNPPAHEHGKGHESKLGLTPDQQAKMRAIHMDTKAKMDAIHDNTALTQEQRQAQKEALLQSRDAQIKAVLTPEQFTAWQAEKAERGGKGGGKH